MSIPENLWSAWVDIAVAAIDKALYMFDILVGFLPDASVEVAAVNFNAVASYLSWVGIFVDITALAAVISIVVGYELLMVTVKLVIWIWRLLPFT